MQKDKIIQFGILILIFLLCGSLYSCQNSNKAEISFEKEEGSDQDAISGLKEEEEELKKEEIFIYVYICGEVQSPGVYQVEEGARLYQVIEMAGGTLESAAPNYLNLAESVSDGQKIVVPTKEEAEQLEISNAEESSGLVNLNTASEETLTTLPGIGTSKAKSIISYRETQGSFQSIEELMEIDGIKEGVFNKVKDLITVK